MKRLLLLNIAVLCCICSSNFALCEESKGFDSTHLQTKETEVILSISSLTVNKKSRCLKTNYLSGADKDFV